MKDFLYNLYQNDNFTLYLTIALVVLVVLFVIVLIFGKKDQKLEETKRLQKIELEGFKEENKEPEKVEVPVKEDVPAPVVEETKEEVVAPVKNDTEEVTVTTFEPEVKEEIPVVEEKDDTIVFMKDDKPLFEAVEDDVPLNIPDFGFDELESNLSSLEDIKKEFNDIEVPSTEEVKEEPVLTENKPNTEVFSSVFVNNSDIPTNNEESKVSLFSIKDDEEDTIELPTLKVEKKEENVAPIVNHEEEKPFSFDDISGETYDIK